MRPLSFAADHVAPRHACTVAETVLRARATLEDRGTNVVARGMHRDLSFEVRFEQNKTRTRGVRPYTTIHLEADAAGAPVRLGPARRGAPHGEAYAAFPQPQLERCWLYGAPRALLPVLASGPLGDRLAALEVVSLEVGPYAQRSGAAKRGLRLVVRGWPLDTRSLLFMLDTLADLHAQIHAAVPEIAGEGAWTLGMLPEVVEHEAALLEARATGRFVLAALLASLVVGTAASLILGA